MFTRRYRKCCCMNNSGCNENKEMLEDKCDNICSCNCENYEKDECECGFDENEEMNLFPENPMLAQSYVPWQYMDKTFKPCVGLKMGTIFPELVSPYMPCQSMRTNEFIAETNKIGKGCNKC